MRFGRCFHTERLVWAPVVIELDPVGDDLHRMLLGLEAVTMHALFLKGPDDALNHAVIGSQQERHRSLAWGSKANLETMMLEGSLRSPALGPLSG